MIKEVVGFRNPTNIIGVLFVVGCEVGRTPAVDRCANVLGGADDDGEDDEDEAGVAVVKTVDEIIIVPG